MSAAIAAVTARVPARDLGRAAETLSIRYRTPGGEALPSATTRNETTARPLTEAERAAYLVVRAPATYAALSATLRELGDRGPDFDPRRLLDLGAGPGVGAWAALARWPDIAHLTLVERDRGFAALGREILDVSGLATHRTIDWRALDLRDLQPHAPVPLPLPSADLVLMSYALGELPPDARDRALDAAWQATTGALVLIEPGTPHHFAAVLDARTRLLRQGATIAAPCPHHGPCPMAAAGDWCHVSARLARTRQHRQLKDGRLSYEDEKFSYLIAVRPASPVASSVDLRDPHIVPRLSVHPAPTRIVRHPRFEKGRVTLTLCTPAGLITDAVGRHARETYRRARNARWGDAWTPPADED